MTQGGDDIQKRIELVKPLVSEVRSERGISDHSKVSNFLPVALGLREVSLTYLPAELPGGIRLGQAIDAYFEEHYRPPQTGSMLGFLRRGKRGGEGSDPEAELRAKRKTLDEAYDAVVAPSDAYVAHLAWLERLELDQMQVKRRPSLREMFIYRDRTVRDRLGELESFADQARERASLSADRTDSSSVIGYVYANEFEPRYLRGLGALLGYPECCIEEYAANRMKGANVEQRAWEQVRAMQEAGRTVDVRAYFVKDFFPCRPDCPLAIAKGETYEAAYEALDGELAEIYTGALWSSFELVQSYPALINQHRRRLEQGQLQ